ncbi:MAG TPA: diguanylate cyclase [Citreicella sp.]|nr:diguanylate cyclase [Citreicella sp.]
MCGSGDNKQGVVSMTDREKERRAAPLRLVESYWRALAGDGQVPLRSQIDPRGIESALPYAFLAERIAPSLAKLRVAGTHLNDLMGMETAGMPLSALIAPDDRDRMGEAVARVFAEGALARIDLRGEEGFGKGRIEAQMLLLPLRSDMGDMTRMIGVLVSQGRIGRTPRRFGILHAEVTPGLSAAMTPAPAPQRQGFAEPPAAFSRAPIRPVAAPAKRAPYLRLIVSND